MTLANLYRSRVVNIQVLSATQKQLFVDSGSGEFVFRHAYVPMLLSKVLILVIWVLN